MTVFAENIRKIMGWCPNASAAVTRKAKLFNDMLINEPNRGEGPAYKTLRWWNKYHNWVLLVSVCLTLIYIKWLKSPEMKNIDFVFAVFFIVLLFIMLTWISGFDSWDRLASSESVKPSTKWVLVVYVLIALITVTFSYLWSIYGWERIPGYFFGFLLVSWGWYLQILYWERKNRKTIVTYGFFRQTITAIDSGE